MGEFYTDRGKVGEREKGRGAWSHDTVGETKGTGIGKNKLCSEKRNSLASSGKSMVAQNKAEQKGLEI